MPSTSRPARLALVPSPTLLALAAVSLLAGPFALSGCEPEASEPPPLVLGVQEHCEATNPLHCMMPWPSQRWLEADSATPTGFRLAYGSDAVPLNKDDEPFDVEPYRIRDGFSPSSSMLTLFPVDVDMDATPGMPVEGAWDLSLAADSPTVIIDLQSGDIVAHMAEVDARAHEDDQTQFVPDKAVFYLRPAARLQEDRRYGVAMRNIHLIDGTVAEPSPAFKALRDGAITTSAQLEARRPQFEALFTALEGAGWSRADLVQGWTFHTGSGENVRGDLIAMRDDAMERVPVGGGECTVTSANYDAGENVHVRLDGTFRVPRYMDVDAPGAVTARGDDGLPAFQGWIDAPFTLMVGASLAEAGAEPGRLLTFGHGLLGSADGEGGGGYLRTLADEGSMVTVATDWQGMSDSDLVTVGRALSDLSDFPPVGERLMQGVINMLVLTRSFKGACKDLAELQFEGHSFIDSGDPYFLAISQGGIMGGTTMALSQDITRGALLVGGINYPVMIGRSVDFEEYEVIYRVWYPKRVDRELMMAMIISMWDFSEPNPWMPHLVSDPIANTPAKQILYQIARDDSQVPNLASNMAARTMGIPLLTPSPVEVWGLETTAGPVDSALVYYDLHREPAPGGNDAPDDGNGAHGDQRWLDATRAQLDAFWREDGQVMHTCDGPCDPE